MKLPQDDMVLGECWPYDFSVFATLGVKNIEMQVGPSILILLEI